jgi:Fe-S-cluster containining protein
MTKNKLYEPNFLMLQASKSKEETKKYLQKVKSKNPRNLDFLFQELHVKTFKTINCLDCANCCKSLGPRITKKDLERLSKSLRMKETEFINTYLKVDEDNDFVFKTMPCPFLMPDNYCQVYDFRPKACREYPHTDGPKMVKNLILALKNSETCPAVFLILEEIKQIPISELK